MPEKGVSEKIASNLYMCMNYLGAFLALDMNWVVVEKQEGEEEIF